jgi:3-hydroxyacyl-CoA dehydrogenase
MSTSTHVTVVGAGVLGTQIAFQVANHGIADRAYDLDDQAITTAERRLRSILTRYLADRGEEDRTAAEDAIDRISFTTDLRSCAADADLVIEAAPEILELKQHLYTQLGTTAPESTIFATNSSTLLPSQLADSTGRPDRFLALHFADHIWRKDTAEIMGHAGTDPTVFERVAAFAEEIGMVPIRIGAEQPGYVLDSLLIPFLRAASALVLRGVADPKTIDTTWRIGTGAPLGPFQILDVVGLRTAYAISSRDEDQGSQLWAQHLKTNYLDEGKLGVESGEGFYTYR